MAERVADYGCTCTPGCGWVEVTGNPTRFKERGYRLKRGLGGVLPGFWVPACAVKVAKVEAVMEAHQRSLPGVNQPYKKW